MLINSIDIDLDVKPNSDLDLINHPLVAKWTMTLQIKYLSQFQSGQMEMLESLCRPWIPLNTSTNEYVEYSSHICKNWCWNRYQFWEYIMYMFLYFPYSNAQFRTYWVVDSRATSHICLVIYPIMKEFLCTSMVLWKLSQIWCLKMCCLFSGSNSIYQFTN